MLTADMRIPNNTLVKSFRFITALGLLWNLIQSTSTVGCLPIHDACEHGDIERVTTLLARDPSQLNVQDPKGWTPLHHACEHGQSVIVTQLLETPGVSLKATSNCGKTPLHLACERGHLEVVNRLLESGVD